MAARVTTYHLFSPQDTKNNNNGVWFQDRKEGVSYITNTHYEQILSELCFLVHTPVDQLVNEQKDIINTFEGVRTPILPGDVVRIEQLYKPRGISADYYLRTTTGWDKFNEDVIQLIKHFL